MPLIADVTRADQTIQPRAPAWSTRLNQLAPPVLLAGIVLALPLEFTRQYFPLPAFDLSRLFMVLAMLTFGLQVLSGSRPLLLPRSWSFALLVLLTAYAAVSAVVIGSGNGEKTALAMVAYTVVMLVVFNWALDAPRALVAWTALAVSALALGVTALLLQVTQTYIWNPNILGNGVMRVTASFADPNNFARFLSFSAGIAIVMFADLTSKRLRALFAAAAVLCAAAIPFTYSRAGWVIFGVCCLLPIALARQRKPALALAGIAAIVFVAVIVLDASTLDRAALLEQNLTSPALAGGRFAWLNYVPLDSVRRYLAAAGLQMFLDHPIFGVGFGGFQQQILTTYSAFIPPGKSTTLPHTSAIEILAELGAAGAVLATVAFGALFGEAWTARRKAGQQTWPLAAGVIAFVTILLASQFAARLFEEPYLWVFLGLFYAAAARPLALLSRTRQAVEADRA